MNLQLLRGKTLPANDVAIVCKWSKPRHTLPDECAIDFQDGSTVDFMPGEDVHLDSCKHFKMRPESRDFNQKIAYWMMEGYLGRVNSVEEVYQRGHKIFMEFQYDSQKESEDPQEKTLNDWISLSTYRRYRKHLAIMRLGFDHVFGINMPDLGKLVPDNGAIKTFLKRGEQEKCSTLLLDGNRLDRDVVPEFFDKNLEHLACFNPRPRLFQFKSKSAIPSLSVLILRGCSLLEVVDESIGQMVNLQVLEISESRSIEKLPDAIFARMSKLQILNLSCLGIKCLPAKSFAKLVALRRLILRGCFRLKGLPSTKAMPNLEVIDLCGAKSFEKLMTTKLGERKIEILDLSHTRIHRVPNLISQSGSPRSIVTHLFLRNCTELRVLDIVEKMNSLKVLDLSGAVGLKKMESLRSDDLETLDLSRTGLESLRDSFLRDMRKLQELNLSETKLSSIPSLSNQSELRRLIVKNCPVKSLPTLGNLSNLEVLDVSGCDKLEHLEGLSSCAELLVLNLSGCAALKEMGENPFGKLTSLRILDLSKTNAEIYKSEFLRDLGRLQILDLSETSIKDLPPMSHLKSLKQLSLAGNGGITAVPGLDVFSELEVLDLSGTGVDNEILEKAPSSLRRLLLKDCSGIKGSLVLPSFEQIQELDLRGSSVTKFPIEDLGKMRDLKSLRLPETFDVVGVDLDQVKLPEEFVWDINCLPESEDRVDVFKSGKILIGSDYTKSLLAEVEDKSMPVGKKDEKKESTSADEDKQSASVEERGGEDRSTSADAKGRSKESTSTGGKDGSKVSTSAVEKDGSKVSTSAVEKDGSKESTSADAGGGNKESTSSGAKGGKEESTSSGVGGGKSTSADKTDGKEESTSADAGDGKEQSTSADKAGEKEQSTSADAGNGNKQSTSADKAGEKVQSTSAVAGDGNKQSTSADKTDGKEQSTSADTGDGNKQSTSADKTDRKQQSTSADATASKEQSTSAHEEYKSRDSHSFRLEDGQWEAFFKHFRFSVSPPDVHFGGDELAFRGRNFANVKPQGRSVEIHGFSNIPESAKAALKQAVSVALIGNSSIESLSDLSFQDMAEIKVCWIRRCEGMKFVIQGKNQSFEVPKRLETLILSNLVSLVSFCDENTIPNQSIESLKHLYVDCCPAPSKIIPGSHLLINLETLQIQFCDNLKVVCDGELPNLRRLKLLGLPKLEQIGCDLPALQSLIIRECPELSDLREFLATTTQLTRLSLYSCPKLQILFSSSAPPANLEELEIRSCDGLTGLIENPRQRLPKLRSLRLSSLPKMENVEGDFPSLETCQIEFCTRLPQKIWPQTKN